MPETCCRERGDDDSQSVVPRSLHLHRTSGNYIIEPLGLFFNHEVRKGKNPSYHLIIFYW